MPYEDESWRWHQMSYSDDLNGPVVWKDDAAAADLFEQEMSATPDPALEDLSKHMDEAWEKLAHLYEEGE